MNIREELTQLRERIDQLEQQLEPEITEGQYWAWHENDVVFRVQKCKINQCEVRPLNRNSNGYASKREIISDSRLLSDHEVEQALIKEANRRGFDEGVKVELNNHKNIINGSYKNYNSSKDYLAWGSPGNAPIIYKQGDWAEIIEDGWEVREYSTCSDIRYKVVNDGRSLTGLSKEEAETVKHALNNLHND